jgi:hypothetical protein
VRESDHGTRAERDAEEPCYGDVRLHDCGPSASFRQWTQRVRTFKPDTPKCAGGTISVTRPAERLRPHLDFTATQKSGARPGRHQSEPRVRHNASRGRGSAY